MDEVKLLPCEDELVELRFKLRMIISHASGGVLSEPTDIDRSTNDICVEISRHSNRIWEHAQETALATRPPIVTDEVVERVARAIWDTSQDGILGNHEHYSLKMRMSWDEARRAAAKALAAMPTIDQDGGENV